jgi:hypothetical protein
MRNYYAVVNVEDRRLATQVSAENVADAFEAATFECEARYPRLDVETIAVQEIVDEHQGREVIRNPAEGA